MSLDLPVSRLLENCSYATISKNKETGEVVKVVIEITKGDESCPQVKSTVLSAITDLLTD